MTENNRDKQAVTETKVVTTSGDTVKITETNNGIKGSHHRPKVAVLLDTDDLVREQVGGFSNFLKEYAVVGLALGFIVGQQANGVVKQFVDSFVDPLFRVLFGEGLSTRTSVAHHNDAIVRIPWGKFVYNVLEFFFVLVSIYLVIKLFKLDRYAKKPEDKKDEKK